MIDIIINLVCLIAGTVVGLTLCWIIARAKDDNKK